MSACWLDGRLVNEDQAKVSVFDHGLYTADECFLTGTAVELVSVYEIDGRQLPSCVGPVCQQLQKAFRHRIQIEAGYASRKRAVS